MRSREKQLVKDNRERFKWLKKMINKSQLIKFTVKNLYEWYKISNKQKKVTDKQTNWPYSFLHPFTSKIWLLVLLSCCYIFPGKGQGFSVRSRWQLWHDKSEYSHYLFAGKCIFIIWRSCILITSGSLRVKKTLTKFCKA